jgi:hypothetical protein
MDTENKMGSPHLALPNTEQFSGGSALHSSAEVTSASLNKNLEFGMTVFTFIQIMCFNLISSFLLTLVRREIICSLTYSFLKRERV